MASTDLTAEEVLRAALSRLAVGNSIPKEEAVELLALFDRLNPPRAWCVCGHEHGTHISTGKPVARCYWLACRCPGYEARAGGQR